MNYLLIFKDNPHVAPNKALIGNQIVSISMDMQDLGDKFFWVGCPEFITFDNFNQWAYNSETKEFVHVMNTIKHPDNRLPITIYE
jgi:hypothetical protein